MNKKLKTLLLERQAINGVFNTDKKSAEDIVPIILHKILKML